jgi:hypothetical protein
VLVHLRQPFAQTRRTFCCLELHDRHVMSKLAGLCELKRGEASRNRLRRHEQEIFGDDIDDVSRTGRRRRDALMARARRRKFPTGVLRTPGREHSVVLHTQPRVVQSCRKKRTECRFRFVRVRPAPTAFGVKVCHRPDGRITTSVTTATLARPSFFDSRSLQLDLPPATIHKALRVMGRAPTLSNMERVFRPGLVEELCFGHRAQWPLRKAGHSPE